MYCLTNLCYVCLETKNNLISSVDSSMSVNKELLDMFDYCAHNLAWFKTKRIILICEECCSRLRETYQFLKTLRKNSAILQGYLDQLNGTTPSNTETEAELHVQLENIIAFKCEIKDEQIYTDECEPTVEETQDVFVNIEDSLTIEEHTWKKEETDNKEEYSMDNNSTESVKNESDFEISVNSNTHITNTILNAENEAEPLIQLEDINQDECEPIIEETQDVFVNTEDSLTIEEHTWKKEETDQEIYTFQWEPPLEDDEICTFQWEPPLEDDEICTFQWKPVVTEMDNVFVYFEESLVKAGIIYEMDKVDDQVEYPIDNNSTDSVNNESDSEISTLHHDEICTFHWKPVITKTEKVFVDFKETLGKAGIISKMDKLDDQVEYPMDNNSTDIVNNESDSEISVTSNTHITDTDSDSSEFTGKQTVATNKSDSNTPADKPHTCSTCSKSFISKWALKRHVRIHTGEKPYKCHRCDKCFSIKSNLVCHMRVHTGEKPFNCDRCDKYFTHQTSLVGHMRTHTGEKPYKCDRCDKCFNTKANLVCHMRIHTGERPYKCDRCDKCFTQRVTLVRHMRTHTGEKPFKCDRCDKSYSAHSPLLYHMRAHIGEKPYKCDRCDKCFSIKSNLVCHMRIHTGERPYKCDRCDKCFNTKPNLVCHMRIHTGEKPFKCDRCDKCFNNKTNLMRHLRTHTGKKN